eukprot:6486862-Amphidinium_carterae.2
MDFPHDCLSASVCRNRGALHTALKMASNVGAAVPNFYLWGAWKSRVIKEPFLTKKVPGTLKKVMRRVSSNKEATIPCLLRLSRLAHVYMANSLEPPTAAKVCMHAPKLPNGRVFSWMRLQH